MSILDKASLIQIPSGYKNGKLYSVKPIPTYGSELVTNGDFSNGLTNWIVDDGTSWTNVNNTAFCDGNNGLITQNHTSTQNKVYKITFDTIATNSSGKELGVRIGGGAYAWNLYPTGTYTIHVTAGSTNTQGVLFYAINGWTGSIDNVSVKEITNIGDFDFSRSSSATRVNSAGLVETAGVVSTTEQVNNGDFSGSSTGWTESGTWTYGNNNEVCTGNGTNQILTQSSILTTGTKYKYSIDIISSTLSSQQIRFYLGGTDYVTYTLNGGAETISAYANAAGTNLAIRVTSSNTSGVLTIDNVSVKEVIENDVPRLDYSDGSCASLLLEPQSTNLVTYSEAIGSNGFNVIGTSIQSNVTTSPDGTTNADLHKEDSSNGSHFMYKDLNLSSGQTYAISVFAKSNGTNRNLRFGDGGVGWSSGFNVNFDLTNGSADSGGVIESYGNGWYRCSVVGTTNATTSRLIIYNLLNTATSYQGNGTSGVYLYGLQIEQGSYPTSYIPTSGATATRTADVCNNAGTSATFNSTEGVLFFEAAALADDLTNRGLALSDGTSNNACRIYYANSSNNIRFLFNVGGAAQVIKSVNLTDITDYNKIAFSYKQDDFKIYINGVKVEEDTSGSVPSANTFSKLSFDRGYGGENFYGKCKQLIVFNEELSDSELATLTTL